MLKFPEMDTIEYFLYTTLKSLYRMYVDGWMDGWMELPRGAKKIREKYYIH